MFINSPGAHSVNHTANKLVMMRGMWVLDSIVVSIPACHAGDRGSIPRRGGKNIFSKLYFSQYTSYITIYQ